MEGVLWDTMVSEGLWDPTVELLVVGPGEKSLAVDRAMLVAIPWDPVPLAAQTCQEVVHLVEVAHQACQMEVAELLLADLAEHSCHSSGSLHNRLESSSHSGVHLRAALPCRQPLFPCIQHARTLR